MTRQEIYNKVAKHLLTQNEKSMAKMFFYQYGEPKYGCAYRSEDKKCAIGCLIPDEMYDKIIEDTRASELTHRFNFLEPYIPENEGEFLDGLQKIHDDHDPQVWRDLLEEFAMDYNLNYDILDEYNR